VQLSYVLKSGDQVEIITAESGRPKVEWLQFLQTRHARNLVVEYFRGNRKEFVKNGKKIYKERISALNLPDDNNTLRTFLEAAQLNDQSEFFFRVALGLIGPEFFKGVVVNSQYEGSHGRYVLARCCMPIPGDPVIGFKQNDGTVIVHKKTCPEAERLASKHGDRVVVPEFFSAEKEFPVRVSITGIDRVGMLSDITQFISLTLGINMSEIHLGAKEGLVEGYIVLQVRSRKNLEAMLMGLRKLKGIQDVVRTDII